MRSTLLYVLFLLNVQFVFCQWENLNTGLTDDLTGVVFFGDNGLVAGKKGLYYTATGGLGASSWKRFEITNNTADAAIYENTSFTHCYSDPTGSAASGFVFACGQNTITKQAVIIKVELPSLKYTILYIGEANSKLNNIAFSSYNNIYAAVGDNGLVVRFDADKIINSKNISTDDFYSVAFYNGKCKIGAEGKIFYFEYLDNNYSFEETALQNSKNKVVAYGSANSNFGKSYSVGDRFISYNTNNVLNSNHTNYYGELNARCIAVGSTTEYIGTDHGIYYNVSNYALEWQSTSLNYAINFIWKQSSLAPVYACGDSGVILKTINGGGTRVPYVKISNTVSGGCAGNYTRLEALRGTVSSCKWLVNNVQVSTSCNDVLTYLFKTAGTYEIKYTVVNGFGVESTDTKNILITPIPAINLPVTISDNILCKSESIDIQIQNSEKDIVYTLKNEDGTKSYGTSEIGNGGMISFKTGLISASGNYFIQAKNVNSNCSIDFNDKIYITVEKTQAKFHADIINAKPEEEITFYQKAVDAQNYKWDFTPNASSATSNVAEAKTKFSKEGDTKIDLEVWSNNGCYDKIEENGPFVYNNPENSDNCWALINDGVDSPWNGYEYEGNYGLTKTDDGFLVSGGFNDQIFDSKIGVKPNFKNKKGSFLTKYDRNGVLKWIVSTEHALANSDRDKIFSSVIDHDGNIYICGTHDGTFIDNKGERIKVSPITGANQNYGYIMKLDKQGKLIWILNSETSGPLARKLYIDKQNNLVTTISLNSYSSQYQLYFNGAKSTVITQTMVTSQADNLTLLKVSPLGAVIWYAGMTLYHVNSAGIVSLGFDDANNIYLGGNYEFDMDFYSSGNTTAPKVLKRYDGYGSRMFLAKYNKDGILQWTTRSSTGNNGIKNNVTFGSMVTDKDGNNYITGSNSCNNVNAVHVFENADESITQNNIGSFFLAKVNSTGTCEWITGSKYANSGGNKIIMDNNKLHIIGGIDESGTFITGNGQNYNLTMSYYDYFLATYDLSGNLKKITANGDNRKHNTVPVLNIYDFFKAENGSFYLCANMSANNYTNFGSIITTNGIDGIVIHFDEDCGILKYENTLSTDDFTKTSNAVVYPNPTSGKVSVDLRNYDGNASVQIYDANGKKISEEKAVDLEKMDLTIHGSQGLYFVKIKAGNKTQNFKVLKQ